MADTTALSYGQAGMCLNKNKALRQHQCQQLDRHTKEREPQAKAKRSRGAKATETLAGPSHELCNTATGQWCQLLGVLGEKAHRTLLPRAPYPPSSGRHREYKGAHSPRTSLVSHLFGGDLFVAHETQSQALFSFVTSAPRARAEIRLQFARSGQIRILNLQ